MKPDEQFTPSRTGIWGALWRSKSYLDGGYREHLLNGPDCLPVIFRTRRAAREWIIKRYGYIKDRADLRAQPHAWMLPKPVRIEVRVK
jgi:hypothetical protein